MATDQYSPRTSSEAILQPIAAQRYAKAGTLGKVMVFVFDREWEGRHYKEKEVTVFYKMVGNDLVVLTAKAGYGDAFNQGANK